MKELDEKYIARCHRKLKEYGAPLSGWYCVEVIDIADEMDDEDATTECELCGCKKVRYIHVMRYDDYFDDFRVGCICAGIMEGDILEAKDRERRCPGRNRYSGVHVFSGKVKCGQCGSWYGSKVWHSNDKYRRTIWQCNHKYDGGEKCKTPVLTDDELKGKYISAVNKLFADKKSILADYNEILAGPLYDTSGLERKRTEYEDEMSTASELVQKEIKKNALEPQDQAEYQKRYDTLTERFNAAKKSLADTEAEISRKELARSSIRQFLATLGKQKDLVTTFDAVQFQSLVDFITVYSKDDIRINFKNGMEIKT